MAVEVVVRRGLSVNVEGHDVDDVVVEDGIVGCCGCRARVVDMVGVNVVGVEWSSWSTSLPWVL